MTLISPLALTVLAPSTSVGLKHSRARRRFRNQVEAQGGIWLEGQLSVQELIQQIIREAPGEYVLILGTNCEPLSGLYEKLLVVLQERTGADVIYANKCEFIKESKPQRVTIPLPQWSPSLLQHYNYVEETFLVRTATFISVGQQHFSSTQWDSWDFLKACAHINARVEHIQDVWVVTKSPQDSHSTTPHDNKDVAVVMPTGPLPSHDLITMTAGTSDKNIGGGVPLIDLHLDAIHGKKTTFSGNHIVVIGEECLPPVRENLYSNDNLRIIEINTDFNFAERGNHARLFSQAELLVFVNDDFIPLRSDWLELLLAPFERVEVGITGGTLLYADDTIQHAGVRVTGGSYAHCNVGISIQDPLIKQLLSVNREVDAVTGACFAIRSTLFDATGGFFEGFPLNFIDVDLCLKVRASGHTVVHVGAPLGYHYESKTRPSVALEEEHALMNRRWPHRPRSSEYPFHINN